MNELSGCFYLALQRPKIGHVFAVQIMTQVIGSFRRESIRFETQTSALMAGLTWQQYPTGIIGLWPGMGP
jgi:hypothetical protein